MAVAPFNFVPLGKTVVPAQERVRALISSNHPDGGLFSSFYPDLNSGYIKAVLSPKTPLFVGKSAESGDFFSINGELMIPGSTLRGMVRSMVQILSWASFKMFDASRVLYYRGLADRSPLRNQYVQRMSDANQQDRSLKYRFKAGYLVRNGSRYSIIPAQKDSAGVTFTTISTVPRGTPEGKITDTMRSGGLESFAVYSIADVCAKLEKVRPDVVSQLRECEQGDYAGGFVATAGDMSNSKFPAKSKHHVWVISPPSLTEKPIIIPDADIRAHENDETRADQRDSHGRQASVDPLRQVKARPGLPCFYIERTLPNGGTRVSFGHTGYFRLAYDLTVGEHVAARQAGGTQLDLDEAIFGRVGDGKRAAPGSPASSFAGRVSFEDARSAGPVTLDSPPGRPAVLSSPKPTSFQLYLEQSSSDVSSLKTYNDKDAPLRGYKLYWHRDSAGWRVADPDYQAHPKQYRKEPINPVLGGSFHFRVRFVNLTDEELGAVLTALQLPDGCFHKLGMGKPLGLGTVAVTDVSLHLTDRSKRYHALFAGDHFEEGPSGSKDITALKKAFSSYVLEHLSPKEKEAASTLWDTPRLRLLKTMLTLGSAGADQTRYMLLREFKGRPVLPHPDKVAQSHND